MQLNLKRPIVFFDLETTGVDVVNDRIVEISLLKVMPDGSKTVLSHRINPGRPIPPQSTAVHHITDEDVKDKPTFRELSQEIFDFFEGCDIGGFNSNKFDIPLLMREFQRIGVKFDIDSRKMVDVLNIFHKMEQRTLSAAYKFYCGKNLEDAHSAQADTMATYEILLSQLDRYSDTLANDMEFLDNFSKFNKSRDLSNRIQMDNQGNAVFNFGKYRGESVEAVFRREPGYYAWMMQGDFAPDTKDVVQRIMNKIKAEKILADKKAREEAASKK